MGRPIGQTERLYSSPEFLAAAITVFVVTFFAILLGFFYLALGVAFVVILGLSFTLPLLTSRRAGDGYASGALRALSGGVIGLMSTLLFFSVISLFIE